MSNTSLYTRTLEAPSVLHAPSGSCPRAVDIELRAAREHARRITELYGPQARFTAAAWDAVDEILSMKANERAAKRTPFELYCEANPEAPEARVYDL